MCVCFINKVKLLKLKSFKCIDDTQALWKGEIISGEVSLGLWECKETVF